MASAVCRTVVLGLTFALAAAAAAGADAAGSATIVNSGSTNFAGWKIAVTPAGAATLVIARRGVPEAGATPKPFAVSAAVAAQFFKDLAAAKAQGASVEPCMKSASFGSTTHVTWGSWSSPDLSCPPASDTATALSADIDAIRKASGLDTSQLHRGALTAATPAPSST
ncbi:MAG TPA: hypothetical protein VMH02_11045 [Verrucomicrobiae bacterium]|nr:hypothetical protein [Verrucomicrobiae bacterium]